MPITSTAGRTVKTILKDLTIRPKPTPQLKNNFCARVENRLEQLGNELVLYIRDKKWGHVYDSFTEGRTLIQIKKEACAIFAKKKIKVKGKVVPEKTSIMKEFESKHPGKRAVWHGKQTEQFKKWKRGK